MIWARRHNSHRFRASEQGATAVEFAILMPIMMVCFGAIVEGARIYWNYQSAVSGVRDATRYLARTVDPAICGGTTNTIAAPLPGGALADAREIIREHVGTGDTNLFPVAVQVDGIRAEYTCPDLNLRVNPTPVAQVQARLTVDLPFGTVFELFGNRSNSQMQSTIIDQSRIYGL